MIFDRLQESDRYKHLHPGFAVAFEFLRSHDFTKLPAGKTAIDGERLMLIVDRATGRGREGARLEAHRRYIDVQYCVSGAEEIGWRPTAECQECTAPYSSDNDITFFADRPLAWIALPPGSFMIFFPSDGHAPLAGRGELVKAVMKVAVEW